MYIEKIDGEKYISADCSMATKKVSLYSGLIILPVYVLYMVIYLLRWNYANIFATIFKFTFLLELFILAVGIIAVQIISLFVKGALLSAMSEGKWDNIKFKFLAENQKPYITINEPLTVSQYRLCQFVYILCFAVLPFAISMLIGDFMFVLASFICVLIAGSDILLFFSLCRQKASSYIIDYNGMFLYKIYNKRT